VTKLELGNSMTVEFAKLNALPVIMVQLDNHTSRKSVTLLLEDSIQTNISADQPAITPAL
jgi:hypothetical protein